jgi:hypothetical protein
MHSIGLDIIMLFFKLNFRCARRTTKLHNLPLSIVAQSQLAQRISDLSED